MPQTAFGCTSMAWDGERWLDHLTNVALWQYQPHQSFCITIIPLKIALRKNGFIKIRLRSEVHVNKKHWLTQSAWLSLEHEVLCDSLQSNGLSPSHTYKQHNDINNTASNTLLFLGRYLFILPSVGTLKGMSWQTLLQNYWIILLINIK